MKYDQTKKGNFFIEFAGGKSMLEGVTEFPFLEGDPENTKRLIDIIHKQ